MRHEPWAPPEPVALSHRPSRTHRSRTHRSHRVVAAVTAALLLVSLTVLDLTAGPAQADTAPPTPSLPATVSTDPLPTVQVDGVVWAQVVVGTIAYAGGRFTTARPAGAAPGTDTVPRHNLLAYDVRTGVLLPSFAPVLNGDVRALTAAPDGTRLFVGGNFTKVGTASRLRLAAFSVPTGALVPGFAPQIDAPVQALAATASTLYLGGIFSTVAGRARLGAAALDSAAAGLRPWAPVKSTSGAVRHIVLSPDGRKVVLGGNFTTMNGSDDPGYGLAAVDATAGTSNFDLPVNGLVRNAGVDASITALAATPDGFYGSGYVYDRLQGNLEGAFKADWNGNLVWLEDCHGDSYSLFPSAGAVYVAGHSHYCGNVGGFGQDVLQEQWSYHRGLAFSAGVDPQPISKDPYGYYNFEGRPRPTLLTWFPDFDTGTFTGQNEGPWHVSGNDDYVLYGGEFTTVNGRRQQGLVRFAKPSLAPNDDGPRLTGAKLVPSLRSFAQGIRVSWPASFDRDNEQLTYQLFRDGAVVGPRQTARSTFWQRPMLSWLDTTVQPGRSYGYRIQVTDPMGNTVRGDGRTVTAAGGTTYSPYDQAVLNDSPLAYWPLGEQSGTTVVDLAGSDTATRSSGVTQRVKGALRNDPGTAYRFNGTNLSFVASSQARANFDQLSVEAWFRTTSTRGGKVVSFGSSRTRTPSTDYDRQIYLGDSGRLLFGVNRADGIKTIETPASVNDGRWHHAVGTLSPAGMSFVVDGQLVGTRADAVNGQVTTGYWRIGGDALRGWPDNPTSGFLAGDIDQVAVYPDVLPLARARAHFELRRPPATRLRDQRRTRPPPAGVGVATASSAPAPPPPAPRPR